MASADTIIQKALSYEGEGGTRFRNAYGLGPNDAWCVAFVWYVFKQAGASNLFYGGNKTAYVGTLKNYYSSIGKFGSTPKKGALVLYDWSNTPAEPYDHVGIVMSYSDSYIHTIEGNTRNSIVAQRDRARYQEIIGYCYPAYTDSSIPGQWIQASDGRWWYKHTDGSYTKNGWEFINGQWYYFDASGWMKTGWIQSSGKWYYCDSNGKMLSNCWVGDYYVGSDGAMLVSTMTPDGYTVDQTGKWDGRAKWVTRLQQALVAAGYNPGAIDGEAGPNTLNACPTLQYGSQGVLVTLLQERLANFFHIGLAGGIDGSFGDGTEAAVIELQNRNGLETDGVVGRATWKALLCL